MPVAPAPAPSSGSTTAKDQELRALAEQFAPVLYHRMAGSDTDHRFDYPTSFDFDGDWSGSNNWANAADTQFKMWSYVYYTAIESDDYYFLYYVVFHPRSWSAQAAGSGGVMDQIQQTIQKVTGKGQKPAAAADHENDLQGVLVIVDKWTEGGPSVAAVETLAGSQMLRALNPAAQGLTADGAPALRLESGHPALFIESQKHDIHPWNGEEATDQEAMVVWRYGKPVEFSRLEGDSSTYELVSLSKTLWKQAQAAHDRGLTYGTVQDFGDQWCSVTGARRPACAIGVVGAALRGDYGVADAATAPWMWTGGDLDPGIWFFDPIQVLRQHFGFDGPKEKYLYHPYLGIGMGPAR
jgi:hypothetical protein